MLGLIVVAPENGPGLRPDALMGALLGVPLLGRAIGGALPTQHAVSAVVVVPADLVERVREEVVERFSLDEVDQVVAGGPDFASALLAGLAALPADVEKVLVQNASQVLSPSGLADRVLASLSSDGAAAPAAALRGHVVADEDGGLMPLEIRPRLRTLQGPQAFTVERLRAALEDGQAEGATDAAELVALVGGSVTLVEGDADNLLLEDEADISRAVEVFSRRAVDYAFLYPRDLLPEDPLKKALAQGEPLEAPRLEDGLEDGAGDGAADEREPREDERAADDPGQTQTFDMSTALPVGDDTQRMEPAPAEDSDVY